MDSINLSFLLHNLIIVSNSLFFGLKITIPLMFVLHFFNKKFNKRVFNNVVVSLNNMLLLAGIIFIFTIISNTLSAWYHNDEFQKQIILSSLSGPKWFQYIIPTVNFGLLPLILCFKRFRKKIYPSIYIVLIWIISTSLVDYFSKEEEYILHAHSKTATFNLPEHSNDILIFICIFIFFYLLISRNKISGN